MRTIESMLKEELYELKEVVAKAKKRLNKVPEGNLRVRNWKGVVEYYYRNTKNGSYNESRENGRYLRKNEMDLACKLAQRDYDICVIQRAEERIRAIDRFLKAYDKTCLKKLHHKTNPYRKVLITPPVLSDEEFVRQWQDVEYKGKPFGEDENIIVTEKALYKLGSYEKNGIYQGVTLFVTYETSKRTLNVRGLDGLIRSLFCVESGKRY